MTSKEKKIFFYDLGKAIAMQTFLEVYLSGIIKSPKFLDIFSSEEIIDFNLHQRHLRGELNDVLEKLSTKLEEYKSEEEIFIDLKRLQESQSEIKDFVLKKIRILKQNMSALERAKFFIRSVFSKKEGEERYVLRR